MKKRVDFSKLVILELAPSEAAVISSVLGAVLSLAEDKTEREILEGTVARINLQLRVLQWPAERARAPFPV